MKRRERMKSRGELIVNLAIAQKRNDLMKDRNLCKNDATPDEDDLNVLHSLMDSNDGRPTLHFSVTSDGVLQSCDSEDQCVNEPCNELIILEETVLTENLPLDNDNCDSKPGDSNVNDQTCYDTNLRESDGVLQVCDPEDQCVNEPCNEFIILEKTVLTENLPHNNDNSDSKPGESDVNDQSCYDTSSRESDHEYYEENLDDPVDERDEENFIESDQNVDQRTESPQSVEDTPIDGNSNKKNRKRKIHVKRDPTYSKNKRSREIGQVYESKKKIDGKWDYKVIKPKKFLKTPCQCKLGKSKSKLQCGLVPDEFRKQLFQKFWQLSWLEKKQFVKGSTVLAAVKRRRGNEERSRRNFSLQYFLKYKMDSFRVCKKMFIGTLCLAENTFLNWVKSDVVADSDSDFGENGRPEQETRSEHKKVKLSENAKIFFNSLAKVESHYCRASSSKLYLEPNWQSKRELYRFYESEWCVKEKHQPVSITTFKNVFEELNLSLFKPKKDIL
ncbi:uncharacterized protein LOC111053764 isoform X2 [Nilaparvata lugens]|uniref:uncharacterized protein LOC111053764 isoform X2 n=1 Tax=Nilaparvata lugens TaxID=108931 RepID=UPI00193DC7C7|nr:uncharacterized protein LOC111053764 isoform X2 [Nilaparvata lugens]